MAFWILQLLTLGPCETSGCATGFKDSMTLTFTSRLACDHWDNFWSISGTTTTMVLTLTLTLLLEFQEIRRTFTLASFNFSNGCHIQGGVPNYPCGKVRCRLYMAPI